MTDQTTIEQQVRQRHPHFTDRVNGVDVVITPQSDLNAYEARIADRVEFATDEAAARQTAEAADSIREAVLTARADLRAIVTLASGGGNLTQSQIKSNLVTLAGTLDKVIGHLVRNQTN